MPTDSRARQRAPGLISRAVLGTCCILLPLLATAHQRADAPQVVAPGYSALQYRAPAPGSYALPPLGQAADGVVLDSTGQATTLHQAFDDRVTVLAFIYTQCDDVNGCPLATFVMSQVAKQAQQDAQIRDRLRLLSYSFDREHDTPEVLARYAQAFRPPGARWEFLTAPDDTDLAQTLAAYEQSVQRSGGHTFAHILRVFLIDGDQRIRNIYSTAFLHVDTVLADIRTLLLEDAARPGSAALPTTPGVAEPTRDDPALGLPPTFAGDAPPPTPAQAALGARLFFDRRLSLNRTISCAMCHVPAQGFTVNELATAVGIEGRTVKRNAPSLLNVGYLSRLFHDGRESRLEHQVWSPLLATNEMANPAVGYVIEHLRTWSDYAAAFRAAFDSDIDMESIGAAFAAYQRTLVAAGSPFDRWHYGGEEQAVGAAVKRGFALFSGKAGCSTCHTVGRDYALFTDELAHNTGVGYAASMGSPSGRRVSEVAPGTAIEYDLAYVAPSAERRPNDLGLYEVTQNPDDRWKYRTPTLRNVALTRPYMHDGSLSTLDDVIAFYDRGGIANPLRDPRLRPLGLTARDRADLRAFLESLTSPHVAALVEAAQAVAITNPN